MALADFLYYMTLACATAVPVAVQSLNVRLIYQIGKYADALYRRSLMVSNALILVWMSWIFIYMVYLTVIGNVAMPPDPIRMFLSVGLLAALPTVVAVATYMGKKGLLNALKRVYRGLG